MEKRDQQCFGGILLAPCPIACAEALVTERSSAAVHPLASLGIYLDLGNAQSVASTLADWRRSMQPFMWVH